MRSTRAREIPQIEQVLPLLHLHGLPAGDLVAALVQFFGSPDRPIPQ